jgi:antitoxin HicB
MSITPLAYPYEIGQDEAGFFLLSFPGVPEAHTDGGSREEAEANALDCLLAALGAYIVLRRDIPRPSDVKRGHGRAVLPPLVAAKLALYQAMRQEGVTQVELARRIGRDQKDVRRLHDLDHRSHIGLVEDALAQLGRRLVVSVETAA